MPDTTAIADAGALASAQARIQQLERLLQISAQLNSTLDFQQLLRTILHLACELLDAEASSIFLIDRKTDELVMALATNIPAEIAPTIRVQRGQGIAGKVAASGETILVPDVRNDPDFFRQADAITNFTTRSILCVPLRTHEASFDADGNQVLSWRIIGVAQVLNKRAGTFSDADIDLFEAMASQAAVALETSMLYEEMHDTFLGVVGALAESIDAKDDYTHGHSSRVAQFSLAIGKMMGLTQQQLATLHLSALLHDVGKIGVPDNVLNKSSRLTDEEFTVIQQHPEIGYRIMSQVPALREALRGMREHHERMDGTGYPQRIAGNAISLYARIIGAADAFDAMTSSRVYRTALPVDEALRRLHDSAGSQLDPDVVRALECAYAQGKIVPLGE